MNKDNGKDTSKLILPPEPTQETQLPKDDQLFKQVPIIEENPKKESFEDMIKTLKEKEAQKQEYALRKADQEAGGFKGFVNSIVKLKMTIWRDNSDDYINRNNVKIDYSKIK